LTYRIRGGLFAMNGLLARLLFAVPIAAALTAPLYVGVWQSAIGATIYALLAVYFINNLGHGTYMDLGRNPNGHLDDPERPISWLIGNEKPEWDRRRRFAHNFSGLLIKGVLLGVLTTVPFIALSGDLAYLAFMLAAASMPLCYLAAWSIPSTTKDFEQGPPLGELLYGAVLGAAASVPLMVGMH
jgi:hypothetical protein